MGVCIHYVGFFLNVTHCFLPIDFRVWCFFLECLIIQYPNYIHQRIITRSPQRNDRFSFKQYKWTQSVVPMLCTWPELNIALDWHHCFEFSHIPPTEGGQIHFNLVTTSWHSTTSTTSWHSSDTKRGFVVGANVLFSERALANPQPHCQDTRWYCDLHLYQIFYEVWCETSSGGGRNAAFWMSIRSFHAQHRELLIVIGNCWLWQGIMCYDR